MRNYGVIILLSLLGLPIFAQVKPNLIIGLDLYQWYKNPNGGPNEKIGASSGSVLLNLPLGLKIFAGHNKFSVSLEGSANMGFISFDVTEFKGMGAIAFPLLAKLNFNGMSGFSKSKLVGWSVGGGIQFTKTEWYGLTSKFDGKLSRKFFPTYVVEIAGGGGVSSTQLAYYLRAGMGPHRAFTFNSGLIFNIDLVHQQRKKQSTASKSVQKS